MNVDCTNISNIHFQKLKEYACTTTHFKIIENLQHFTDHNIFQDKDSLQVDMLKMDQKDPNQVIILLMILLTVYVDQNSQEKSNKALIANKKRKEVLDFFNFPKDTVNYTIHLQWNGEFLKSGITITDLPGLGAYAPDKDMGKGKLLKGHDSISTEAIKKTDAMVFLVDPQVDGAGVPALQVMISNAQLKEVVNQNELVIPVLNKIDDCNGQSEVDQAIDKFVDILKNTGINKKNEEIHLYSAWYGEYKFKDFPIEKTCFYFRNSESIRNMLKTIPMFKNMTDEQLDDMVKTNVEAQLKDSYEKGGIEELKTFFRSAYISKSKNRRSQAAVLAVRKLALDVIIPIENLLQNFDILQGVTGKAIENISNGLKKSIDQPISEALSRIEEMEHDEEYISEMLEDIPEAYVMTFQNALEEYKTRNQAICRKFSLGWLGMSDNARIDQIGSANRLNYLNLCEEIEKIGIDVKRVNKKFNIILKYVTGEIDAIYNNSLKVLQDLKTNMINALQRYEEEYRDSEKENSSVLHTVKALKDTLTKYMEQQINAIIDSMKISQNSLVKAGNDTVDQILDLNTRMVNLYTKSVLNEVKAALSRGAFFSSREYIKVTGNGGVLGIFNNLSLSADDRNYIENEVKTIGIASITNNLQSWYLDTENTINMNFTALREQVIKMMDHTVEELCSNEEEIKQKRANLSADLEILKSAFSEMRKDIQELYEASLEEQEDSSQSKYAENIFVDILA